MDQLCLLTDHMIFVKFVNQNFPSVRIFVFRETIKFLFILQAQQFAYALHQKVKLYTIFLYLNSLLATNLQWESLQHSPVPPNCWNTY